MVQLIYVSCLALLQLGILNALCFEKTCKDEHGFWRVRSNKEYGYILVDYLTVLNPHSTFKSKSCESFYSETVGQNKKTKLLRTAFVSAVKAVLSLGPLAMRTCPHP